MKTTKIFLVIVGLVVIASVAATLWAIHAQRELRGEEAELGRKSAAARAAIDQAKSRVVTAPASAKNPGPGPRPPRPNSGPDWNRILARHPELQQAFERSDAARRDQTYGSLYRRLHLTRAQMDRLDYLMAKDVENSLDIDSVAQSQNLPRTDPAIVKLIQAQKIDLAEQEKAVLGPTDYPQFETFNAEMPIRSQIGQAAALALASGSPFSADQEEQVTQLLAQTTTARLPLAPQLVDVGQVNWEAGLAQATGILNSDQIAAVRAQAALQTVFGLEDQYFNKQPNSASQP